jgi:putative glutamine amidotransferase
MLLFKKMDTNAHMPVIGIPADSRRIGALDFQLVGEKYITAVLDGAGGYPMLIPSLADRLSFDNIIDRVDGVLLTGNQSNVEPRHYGGGDSEEGTLHDPKRDAMTLPLIRVLVEAGVPVFGICRGFQEMNVAYGGTLHQKVHEVEGHHDHREPDDAPEEVQYGPSHDVRFTPDGLLAALSGADRARVNSLHWQGVDRLGEGLVVEARAADGLIEAFRVADAPAFALAVQWHPEWQVTNNPLSMALFKTFGDACRERANKRRCV